LTQSEKSVSCRLVTPRTLALINTQVRERYTVLDNFERSYSESPSDFDAALLANTSLESPVVEPSLPVVKQGRLLAAACQKTLLVHEVYSAVSDINVGDFRPH
jgi:hypothetical protein